jgi:hypothetical protein
MSDENKNIGPHAFTVDFTYGPNDGEAVIVIADTFPRALDEAYEERTDPRNPIEIEITDPSLGAVLKFIGEGAKVAGKYTLAGMRKAGELGAKFAIRGGHVAEQAAIAAAPYVKRGVVGGARLAGKGIGVGVVTGARGVRAVLAESSRMALYEIDRAKVRRMIAQAYSHSPVEAKAARAALYMHYPDVYDLCHFSRDEPIIEYGKRYVTRHGKHYVVG